MLTRLGTKAGGTPSDPGERLLEWSELIVDLQGNLTIRPRMPRLPLSNLVEAAERLIACRPASFACVRFDLSMVEELEGPWGSHFAVLIHLAQILPCRVQMERLHAQPAALAWVFRSSPDVRRLFAAAAA
jgi:hypothetical protein